MNNQSPSKNDDVVFALVTTPKHKLSRSVHNVSIPSGNNGTLSKLVENGTYIGKPVNYYR